MISLDGYRATAVKSSLESNDDIFSQGKVGALNFGNTVNAAGA